MWKFLSLTANGWMWSEFLYKDCVSNLNLSFNVFFFPLETKEKVLFELLLPSACRVKPKVIRDINYKNKQTNITLAKASNYCDKWLQCVFNKSPVRPPGWACSHSLLSHCFCLRKDFLAVIKWQEWRKFATGRERLWIDLLWVYWIFLSQMHPIYPRIYTAAQSKNQTQEENMQRERMTLITFSRRSHSMKLLSVAMGGSHKCFQLLLPSDL